VIEVDALTRMADSLRVYDVDQDGWEGDPEGSNPKSVESNLTHVGKHLAGVLAFKEFANSDVVQKEIVPDFMQYGLRIARWGGVVLNDLVELPNLYIKQARQINYRISEEFMKRPVLSLMLANGILLGKQMHDEDHESVRQEAQSLRSGRLKDVAKLLIQCAVVQSNRQNFDIEESFEDRLTVLRQRFGIPKPDEKEV